eukprot:1668193-Alexandrium_andersonii.AAC.1
MKQQKCEAALAILQDDEQRWGSYAAVAEPEITAAASARTSSMMGCSEIEESRYQANLTAFLVRMAEVRALSRRKTDGL